MVGQTMGGIRRPFQLGPVQGMNAIYDDPCDSRLEPGTVCGKSAPQTMHLSHGIREDDRFSLRARDKGDTGLSPALAQFYKCAPAKSDA